MITLAVIPVLIGPLQALMAILPGLLLALAGLVVSMFRPSAVKAFLRLLWTQKAVLLALAALVAALVYFRPSLFPGKKAATTMEADRDWPLSRGSPDRRGFVPGREAEPARGAIAWAFRKGDFKTFYASPAAVGNRLYVVGSHFAVFADRGLLACLDADSGEMVWSYSAGGFRSTFSSPVVSGDHLVVGEGLHETRDARIFCFDIRKSEARGEGVKLWDYRTRSHVESTPCISGDRVFVGAGDDGFYCLALAPDADGKARVIWHVPGEKYPDCETSPVVDDGRVYFGLGAKGQAVVCLEAATGKELWRQATPYPVFGSPAAAGGRVVVGMGVGNYIQEPEEMAEDLKRAMRGQKKTEEEIREAVAPLKPAGEVWCLDSASGETYWRFKAERTVLGCPAVADDRVYFGSRDRHFYCVALDNGALLNKWNADDPIISGAAVGDVFVYCLTQNGRLYCLDRSSLHPAWAVNLNAPLVGSPAVARGRVYAATEGNGVLCLAGASPERRHLLWRGYADSAGGLLPERTTFGWRSKPESAAGDPFSLTTPLAAIGDALYSGVQGTSACGLAQIIIVREESQIRGARLGWFQPSSNPVTMAPAATADQVYFVDGSAAMTGRRLSCLSATNGSLLWQLPVAAGASGGFVISPSEVFIVDRPDGLSCYRARDGAPLWGKQGGEVVGAPAQRGQLLFYARRSPAALLAVDAPTGLTLWERELEDEPLTGPLALDTGVWVGGRKGLTQCDPVSGAAIGHVAGGPVEMPLVANGGLVAGVTATGDILLAHATCATNAPVTVKAALAGMPPLLGENAMVYFSDTALVRFDLGTGENIVLQKIYEKWDGKVTSPAIALDAHILYATQERGLICLMPK